MVILEQWITKMERVVVTSKEDLIKIIKSSSNDADLNYLDVSKITDMSDLFYGSEFNGDISEWDVSNVKNMSYMFQSSTFNGDLSKWDVNNVTNMLGMFYGSKITKDSGIGNWDIGLHTTINRMFYNTVITKCDIYKWTRKYDVFNTNSGVYCNAIYPLLDVYKRHDMLGIYTLVFMVVMSIIIMLG